MKASKNVLDNGAGLIRIHTLGTLLILVLWANGLPAQDFLNVGFEYATPRAYPLVWQVNEGKGLPSSIRVDSNQAFAGRKSLLLTARQAPLLLAGLFFNVDQLKGHTLTMRGQIRTDSLQNGVAQLMHYDYGRRSFGFSAQTVSNTTDWQVVRHSFSVPSDAQGEGFVVGIKVSGTGKVYLDDVQLEIDGHLLTDVTPRLMPLSATQRAWLNQAVLPLRYLSPKEPLTDLAGLQTIIGSSRLVGLGENSHGSGSTFRLKHRLIRYLVEHMGFTVVALEAPAPEADRINRYVQGGEGSLAQVVQDLGFKSWQTEEVLALIEWMRAYNQGHGQRIEFRGFDLQSLELPLQNLIHYSHQQDSGLAARVQRVGELLKHKPLPDSVRKVALEQVREISRYLGQQKQATPNDAALVQLQHDADILAQTIGLPLFQNRRQWMAQNIKWLVDHHPSPTKMVIWAHNGHISKQPASMGQYLREQYGNDYVAIGFTFQEGTYSTYGGTGYFDAEAPYPGTYEYLLGQSKYANYVLPLSDLKIPPNGQWLKQALGFRFLETEPVLNQFRYLSLTDHFDALIYMQASQRSIYLSP